MEIVSLGYRTDIALLERGGSSVEHHGDHVVVRSPHNPSFWWGNFLLVADASAHDADRCRERFADAFPAARHVAIGFDGTRGQASDLAAYVDAGLTVEASAVMTARSVHPPSRPNTDATYRRLTSDDDWAQSVELRVACNEDGLEPVGYREFAIERTATSRELSEAGHGGWFGAFLDGRLVSQMGLVTASPGLARFQSVETHPDVRGRGLAGTLVHHVSRYGFGDLEAQTLVMVADPEYLAIRVYRSVGFAVSEKQLGVQRRPPEDAPGPPR